jgi:hypothetical protein
MARNPCVCLDGGADVGVRTVLSWIFRLDEQEFLGID